MTDKRRLILVIPAVVLVLCLVGSFLTQGAMANLQFLKNGKGPGSRSSEIVDQLPLQTAQALTPLAVSAEEQAFAHESLRVADHEVDQAFAMALRQANAENRTLTGKALEVSQKVTALQQTVKDDQAGVDALVASAKARNPGVDDDELDVAKAQLSLDTDELTDTQNNLAVVSGDQRGKIQEELAAHDAGMKKYDEHTDGGQTAVISSRRYGTLAGRLKGYFDQLSRESLIEQAKTQADADAKTLTAQYATLQQKAATLTTRMNADRAQANAPAAAPVPATIAGTPTAAPTVVAARPSRLISLRRLEAQKNILGILDDRIEGQKELSTNYAKWLAQVQLQHRIVVHLILQSFAWIAFIVLCAGLTGMLVQILVERRMKNRTQSELRSMHTLLTVLRLVVQLAALMLILLVVFGPPSQVPTILGLATAGLTVVFQDHILAFFGWFVLMGRNGIRIGDWVEISGVGGEVVEVGLFRTTLLEMGNWTEKGHPTGRRISFVNKFAMSGQYFNFSTNGQWMWDELTVNSPASEDSFAVMERIRAMLVEKTAEDTALAEAEWKRSTQQNVFTQFSATPSVEMRPAAAGIDLVIRYVTRAGDRLDMRNKLAQAVIGLMRGGAVVAPPAAIEAQTG
ncbi:mechanosensitive ion channel family protein [Granulicella arctica]|uniref:mechanosensitive ion channel family protein n=1 Tax=Granulicella arctica TaxID=940613 RepID=UPI0021E04231|nr:mechanosensitive ion channel family protein [Granulicella arctica]